MTVMFHLSVGRPMYAWFMATLGPPSMVSRYRSSPQYRFSRCHLPSPQGAIFQIWPANGPAAATCGVSLSVVYTSSWRVDPRNRLRSEYVPAPFCTICQNCHKKKPVRCIWTLPSVLPAPSLTISRERGGGGGGRGRAPARGAGGGEGGV